MKLHWSYSGDHFTIYTSVKSSCYILSTDTMLYINSISMKPGKNNNQPYAEAEIERRRETFPET